MKPFLPDILSSNGKIYQITKFTIEDFEEASIVLIQAF